jgi:hypothetical protein
VNGLPPLSLSAETARSWLPVHYALDLLELDGRNLRREPIKKERHCS